MKVIVLGSRGQLGVDMVDGLNNDFEVISFSREQLDVTSLPDLNNTFSRYLPDVVINCSAYTNVEKAEVETDKSLAVNYYGARNVAIASDNVGAKVVYISTDYVFDGKSSIPYTTDSPTKPLNQYGKSKKMGEVATTALNKKSFVVRTSWLYGNNGSNFVKTMLGLANRDRITVVSDQVGSPTCTVDLVNYIRELIKEDDYGIHHACSNGSCSWYEFAQEIFDIIGSKVEVIPISSSDFGSKVNRPSYSVMDNKGRLAHWKLSLRKFLGGEL